MHREEATHALWWIIKYLVMTYVSSFDEGNFNHDSSVNEVFMFVVVEVICLSQQVMLVENVCYCN